MLKAFRPLGSRAGHPMPIPAVPRPVARSQVAPVCGPTATRTLSVGIGPRAAMLALTSQSGVPTGQRANLPEMFRHIRRVLSMDLDRGLVSSPAAATTGLGHKYGPGWKTPVWREWAARRQLTNPRIKSPLLCSFILLEVLSSNASTCRELPFCPVARIRAALRIPGCAGPYRGIRANMEQTSMRIGLDHCV